MDTKELAPVDIAKYCLDNHESFVLHGGAGSGKTESLKDLLQYMAKRHPAARIACITHTNNAVNEIKMRTMNAYPVSTIHSFFNEIIKGYRKNIKSVIHELFVLPQMAREPMSQDIAEVDYKKAEHEKYKYIYGKYAEKLYSLERQTCEKAIGKREYDKDPESYNSALNRKIQELNNIIIQTIHDFDYSKIKYNQTRFNSFIEVSYGHDGLLDIVHLLFERYPLFRKIICDKYDYIFIDEYQDTRSTMIEDFLATIHKESNFAICLFGDSMQSIYGDGIGNVEKYVESGILYPIHKKDNYRCSFEVLELINNLRLDNIKQNVALAIDSDGQIEKEEMRHGNVHILYAIYNQKPTIWSPPEEKETYQKAIDALLNEAKKLDGSAKILILTNKGIAAKEGFSGLYKVFADRYIEISDRMDDFLKRSQITDLCELCYNYSTHNYNPIITSIKRSGYIIQKSQDKVKLQELFDKLINEGFSLFDALDFTFSNKLLSRSETYTNLRQSSDRFLLELGNDPRYQMFKTQYESGENTFSRIRESLSFATEEEFDDYEKRYKKECFLREIFSGSIKFTEAMNYYKYVNEDSMNITMHRTKGSSIRSIIVVMEEYFWTSEYDFSLLYSGVTTKQRKKDNSQKLIYVACSRARKDLICLRLIEKEEEELFRIRFPKAQVVNLEGL